MGVEVEWQASCSRNLARNWLSHVVGLFWQSFCYCVSWKLEAGKLCVVPTVKSQLVFLLCVTVIPWVRLEVKIWIGERPARLLPSPQERTRLNGITCHDGYCEVVCQERLMGGENAQDVKDMAVPGFIKECFSCVLFFLGFLAFDFFVHRGCNAD